MVNEECVPKEECVLFVLVVTYFFLFSIAAATKRQQARERNE
jgi:hypothetical protein